MKVSIIGAGVVGSSAAFALQFCRWVREVAIIDVSADLAKGEALDLLHGTSITGAQTFISGNYDVITGSDIVIITAGFRRKPEESRLELIDRNSELFAGILSVIRGIGLSENAVILVVSNPVDILTKLAVDSMDFPSKRIIGLGTVLDTARFRSLLGQFFKADPAEVDALILGEHGDSMVPVWSTASIGGIPIRDFPGYDDAAVQGVFERTKQSGAELIRLKGGAGHAVGLSIKSVVDAIALDKKAVLPVSSLMQGYMDLRDVCLGVPTVVGSGGAEKLIEVSLSDDERAGLRNSADMLKQILKQCSNCSVRDQQ